MIFIAESDGIKYGLLESGDIVEMADLLAGVFSCSEPMSVAIRQPFEDVYRMVSIYGEQVLNDGLTLVARAVSSGRLVGASLNKDFSNLPPAGLEEAAGSFGPISAILDRLDEMYRQTTQVAPGRIMHLFMGAVSDGYGGRGIARTLVRLALANGKSKGYEYAVAEATGNISQHILLRSGFAERFRTAYKEFTYLGHKVFEMIEIHEAVILMERRL